ncbi:MAG TPA: NusG domain II-containing protein [Clostridia bacterium]|nr:NusG domain II-containing protein [Clostridia bacterium]
MKSERKFFRRSDILIVLLIVVISVSAWFIYNSVASKKKARAEIWYYSELVATIDLDTGEDKTFSIPQNSNVIFHLYPDGKICFEQSDCPDKICILTGKISVAGQSAACLPNGIILKIVSDKPDKNKPDIIS